MTSFLQQAVWVVSAATTLNGYSSMKSAVERASIHWNPSIKHIQLFPYPFIQSNHPNILLSHPQGTFTTFTSSMKQSKASPESLTFQWIVKDIIRSFRGWLLSGTPPPAPQRRMLYVITFLIAFGIGTAVAFAYAVADIAPFNSMNAYKWLPVLSFLGLCPGLYGAVVAFCCWRNVHGYDWWIIPGLDL